MMLKAIRILLALAFTAGACACDKPQPVDIARVDQVVAEFPQLSDTQQQALYDSLRLDLDAFFAVIGQPSPALADIDAWGRSQTVTMFQPHVDRVFPNVDELERQAGYILANAAKHGLTLPQMRLAAVVWGKPQKMVRVDSVMLIALNHYLGADFEGYSHLQPYRRCDNVPAMIPYDLAAALAATQHPMDEGASPTLLNWLLYEGALMEARMRLVPDAQLDRALGYTPEQLAVAEDGFKHMWDELALRRWLYTTDQTVIDRLLTAAPASPLLEGQAPGRVGRYIGYRIVKAYMAKHPDTSLDQLLSPDFYLNNQSLIDSGI